jgi:HAD superfamily hydrolase (TIGR01509 family)
MLLVFDCDGVIVDSEIIAAAVDAELLSEDGYEITAAEVNRRFAGMTSREIAAVIQGEIGRPLPDSFFERAKAEIDQRLAAGVQAMAGINEVLDRLDDPRCLCSNSASERIEISLKKTLLFDRFAPYIFSAVEVGTREPKPSPNVYRYALDQFRAAPREAVVIEDSVPGVIAARAAGTRVVGFTGGSHTFPGHADLLTDAGAETVIRRLADLPAVVEAMRSWEGWEVEGPLPDAGP